MYDCHLIHRRKGNKNTTILVHPYSTYFYKQIIPKVPLTEHSHYRLSTADATDPSPAESKTFRCWAEKKDWGTSYYWRERRNGQKWSDKKKEADNLVQLVMPNVCIKFQNPSCNGSFKFVKEKRLTRTQALTNITNGKDNKNSAECYVASASHLHHQK